MTDTGKEMKLFREKQARQPVGMARVGSSCSNQVASRARRPGHARRAVSGLQVGKGASARWHSRESNGSVRRSRRGGGWSGSAADHETRFSRELSGQRGAAKCRRESSLRRSAVHACCAGKPSAVSVPEPPTPRTGRGRRAARIPARDRERARFTRAHQDEEWITQPRSRRARAATISERHREVGALVLETHNMRSIRARSTIASTFRFEVYTFVRCYSRPRTARFR